MNKKTVYIETSIVSYLIARPSSNLLAAAWQKMTVDWWDKQRIRFDLYTSDVVLEEAGKGDSEVAKLRINILDDIPVLALTSDVRLLSKALLYEGAVPIKAIDDSLHIAISAVHGIDYLLTWNFRHIDNAEMKPLIRVVCLKNGFICPEICTPQELMGEYQYD
jgi:hypothetical protein